MFVHASGISVRGSEAASCPGQLSGLTTRARFIRAAFWAHGSRGQTVRVLLHRRPDSTCAGTYRYKSIVSHPLRRSLVKKPFSTLLNRRDS